MGPRVFLWGGPGACGAPVSVLVEGWLAVFPTHPVSSPYVAIFTTCRPSLYSPDTHRFVSSVLGHPFVSFKFTWRLLCVPVCVSLVHPQVFSVHPCPSLFCSMHVSAVVCTICDPLVCSKCTHPFVELGSSSLRHRREQQTLPLHHYFGDRGLRRRNMIQ